MAQDEDGWEQVAKEKLWKKVIIAGSGAPPNAGDTVRVHYDGRLLTGERFDCSRERGELFEFVLGKGRVIKGWDAGVATMLVGEKCLLKIASDWAYGKSGSPPKIPPDATLQFEIELFEVSKPEPGMEKESWEYTSSEKLEAAQKRKDYGNLLYKRADFSGAAKRYESAAQLLESDYEFTSEEKEQKTTILCSVLLNLTQARLKLNEFKEACDTASKVLAIDPANVKALYRRGQAKAGQGDYAGAREDLQSAKKLDETNTDIVKELASVVSREAAYKKKSSEMYKKMF